MRRILIFYACLLGVVFLLLGILRQQNEAGNLGAEFYSGAIAILFTILGIWVGLRFLKGNPAKSRPAEIPSLNPEEELERLGISPREYEVLQLMSEGLSNQEIADRLFVSINTVKTHSANLFSKLDVSRRTQAVHRAKELFLIN